MSYRHEAWIAVAIALLVASMSRVSIADDASAGNSPTVQCDQAVDCRNLGDQYYRGLGVPKEPKVGADYYRLGCDKGDSRSCVKLASVLFAGVSIPGDEAGALRMYQRACDLGDNAACANAAQMFEQGSGKVGGVPQDLLQAAKLYERACNANDACACVNLSELYLQGRGVKKDRKRGAALRRKGYRGGCDPRE